MAALSLVAPMAGRGSRFLREGRATPKPLIELEGRPFFWWAIESLRRVAPLREIVAVTLAEHERDFAISQRIRAFYPQAKIVALEQVTSGAAETALHGLRALEGDGPVAVNDCDHAFRLAGAPALIARLRDDADAALVGFRSQSPAYSYVELGAPDADGAPLVRGTVEKRVVSPFAIAGCYFFASPQRFESAYRGFAESCPYDELFVSGLYNVIAARKGRVLFRELERHVSFGTPEEMARVDAAQLRATLAEEGGDAG